MQGAEGRPSAKPSPVGAAETASDPLEPMVGGDRPFPSNFSQTHSRVYLGCLTQAESALQTKQASMKYANQFRHPSHADRLKKTSGAARQSMLLSRDRKQALKCIDAEGDVQAAERAMLAATSMPARARSMNHPQKRWAEAGVTGVATAAAKRSATSPVTRPAGP